MENQQNIEKNKNEREVDVLAKETYSWWKQTYAMIQKKKIRTWKAVFIVAFFAGAAAATVWGYSINVINHSMAAEEATFYLDPPNITANIGEDVDLDVLMDTKNNDIVAAKVTVIYNPINLSLESWDTSNSAFASGNTCQYQGKPCEIITNDPDNGRITITVAKPSPGINSSSATVASLKFKSLAPVTPVADNVAISYLGSGRYDDSDAIIDNGSGTDVLNYITGSQVTINPPDCTDFTYSDWTTCQPDGTQSRTVASSSPEGCTGGEPTLEQSCTFIPPTCTNFTYSDWGDCQPDGTQSRTVSSSSPAGCTGGNPDLERSCTYTPPTCTDFTYSDWTVCQPDGTQSRTVISSIPDGCNGGTPILEQDCDINPGPTTCTNFTYSDWTDCQPDGTQSRTVSSSSPAGCTGGNPNLERSCTYTPPTCTDFTYSDWTVCQPDGTQSRTIVSSSPDNCIGGDPDLDRSCNYTQPTCTDFTYSDWTNCQPDGTQSRTIFSSSPSGCIGGNPNLEQECDVAPPTCTEFQYSDWGDCQPDGTQNRTVSSASPNGCSEGNPALERSCKYEEPESEVTCTSFKYGDWKACQPDGTRTRKVVLSLPKGCNGGNPVIKGTCTYTSKTKPSDKDKDKEKEKEDKEKKEEHAKPVITDLPYALNKIRGAKVWWEVKHPWRVDHYNVTFDGVKTKTDKASFIIPPRTSTGIHSLKMQVVNKSGTTKSRTVWIWVR